MTDMCLPEAVLDIQIPFYDVDSMDIVWHGHYLKYFEDARCRLLDAIGYNYIAMRESGYGWPVVDVRLKYVDSARFNRRVRVVATLVEWQIRLKIQYRIIDLETDRLLTKGYTVQVAVSRATGEMCYATPPILEQKLRAYDQQRTREERV
ncbi:acyl-CoA thioesterase [Marinimicrobium sp. ARAG 43.8]|uniref:acyl-CoA thioesterase n=1 Tax=Marinimicrobium sp. ARAG 43.8 TaxID=3418719 RepID=UPI003CFB5016